MHRKTIASAAAALLLATACGESRQEKFEKAMQAAEVAQTSVASAREEYAKRDAAYAEAREAASEAEAERDVAQRKLDAANTTLESARIEVAKWADDASVTRVLQQRLLDEKSLETAAVSGRVEQGVALLEGSVPDESARERAVEIARETPGVIDVRDSLGAATPPAAAPAPEIALPESAQPLPIEPEPMEPALEPTAPH